MFQPEGQYIYEDNAMQEQVKVVRNGGVLEITLDNPKVNAIDITIS